MTKISVDASALAARSVGGPAGFCGSVFTISSEDGADRPAGPSAMTRIVYLVAGLSSSMSAAYGSGGPASSCCCHMVAKNISKVEFNVFDSQVRTSFLSR